MALTRNFKETIQERARCDESFRNALLTEAIQSMLSNDMDTGKAVLRDYINATIGFEKLARDMNKSPKSLMRMLGATGNPRAHNLFSMISYLQKQEGVHLEVRTA